MFDTFSEKIVTILGGLGMLFVASAAWLIDNEMVDNHQIISLVNIFNHFILVIIALPFMLKTLFEQKIISRAYLLLLNLYSLMNAAFIVLVAIQAPDSRLFLNKIDDSYIFMFMAVMELLPVYLTIYQLRCKRLNFEITDNVE